MLATAIADLADHRDQQGTHLLTDLRRAGAERRDGQRGRLGQLSHGHHAQALQRGQPGERNVGLGRLPGRGPRVLVPAQAELYEDPFGPDGRGVGPCRPGVRVQGRQHGLGARQIAVCERAGGPAEGEVPSGRLVTRLRVCGARLAEQGIGVRMSRAGRDRGDQGDNGAAAADVQPELERLPQTGEGDRRLLQCHGLRQPTEQESTVALAATTRRDLRRQEVERLHPASGQPELIRGGEEPVPSLLDVGGDVVGREHSGGEG